uniref:Legume lectin n=1 Tax=Lablab purpureus TaxID=35936 RepID=UPI000299CE78|nr:Chain A, Legume lectin [Lablab purpureus]3UJO_B Chain B, Legume lectin [Lablab purpureus]3UJO_C Chain C, Legume lectin [Lablab purpureus]3UJO_D Chain D, Legume lectin [Lablab purpureus]3UJQ_A Chain A, Legume lectin [Lablab purpureus]3UJQ_B Chain B, Legume lectin [Lablab purpureus]3UJQ_C Chain C, Legume lectin [Lablab purpureus]3UJQ_D Chain D, Legume lectin [Lablab purpureus]3UK9_A Chain A, Legume lectin [Lablab purpureus]3UK9_B Chain B, Legume lectin [Lablab purpureus]3UK9_C Chain C, L
NNLISFTMKRIVLFLILLTKAASANLISFTFKKFNETNLILQRDATVSSGKLRITKAAENGVPTAGSLGRAFYSTPIQIWDNTTGTVASWATSFTFNLQAPNAASPADGLAFALVPVGSQPKDKGGFLGLFDSKNYASSNQTVAVEFDTFYNGGWDPTERHIGIDVNSIKSIKTTSWDFANGENAEVLITYDSSTNLLVASLVHPSQKTSFIVSERVDLTSVLPEWVSVGFSATTGLSKGYVETNEVLSWSFASKLSINKEDEENKLAIFNLEGKAINNLA